MPITIGLMGFGRIGRNLFRMLSRSDDIRIGAISDTADPEALTYLVRYDTMLGRFPDLVSYKNGHLYTYGREIPLLQGKDPGDVRWSDYDVDYVVEATGRGRSRAELQRHLDAGARRVVICTPPKDKPDISVVYGVNDHRLRAEHKLVSNASNTAHCAAPILAALHGAYGIERAHITSIHAITSIQRLADVPADDLRLSRAAAQNIVPSDTNAAAVLEEVLPELRGKLRASALRVPVTNGSIVDMTLWLNKGAAKDGINEVIRTAAAGPYKQILEYNEDPIVSSDVVATSYSSIFDSQATMTMEGNLAKVIAWFDNGWGYAQRVVDMVQRFDEMDAQLAEEGR